ncbi:putative copper resistance protein D [Nitrosomonas aestuarii]|uniref:Putative copper resistance protein D n=1 Tax=Nitrosomonas aestuarii TaxID=52441 RepID=A0A1I3YYW4_9PROT|nr:CopD family protein [Nitrosomonas aestuarii]SFK37015.1 putative copper resistance protein D [Nitrosomonas aestuarii]
MLEIIAAAARWFQLAANLILLGSCVFLVVAGADKSTYTEQWVERLERLFPKLAISIVIGLIVILAATIGLVTGEIDNILQLEIWIDFISNTRTGQIWGFHVASAILLTVTVLYLLKKTRTRWRYIVCALMAMLPLVVGAMVSHVAAEGLTVLSFLPYALHIILAGVWLGGLPALLLLKYTYVKQVKSKKSSLQDVGILKRFSAMALPVMSFIIITGIVVGDHIFDGDYAALVASPYGWLLNTKLLLLCIVLIIASSVRSYWLPLFSNSQNSQETQKSAIGMRKWVRIEFLFAMLLVLVATILANNTTPAKHVVIEEWPFPFRFSIIATWGAENVALQVWSGIAIAVLAVCVLYFGRVANWSMKRLVTIPAVLIISGMAVALPPLTIEAYPETYKKPPVPFDAISISYGAELYSEYCIDCHGHQGKGNGIKARTLSTIVPDMLTEPHTVEHTPGDFYHWITFGMKNTDMPGYADKLSEEERWDLVNYVYALSRGYQARILSPEIIPNRANVQPPLFSFATHDGTRGILQDFRDQKSVLLVIFTWPQSADRIGQLKQNYEKLNAQDIAILAVPAKKLSSEELVEISQDSPSPFPLVTQGAEEIVQSYALSRRTLSHPDLLGRGSVPDHMEFLIDRNGYLRARWIPSAEESGWSDIELLLEQAKLLNKENLSISAAHEFIR